MAIQDADARAGELLSGLQPPRSVVKILERRRSDGEDAIDADLVERVCVKLRREEDHRIQSVGVGRILREVGDDHRPLMGNVGYLLPPLLKTLTNPSLMDEVGEAVKYDAFRSMERLLQLALRAELERFQVPLVDALRNRSSPLITGDSPSVLQVEQARSYCRCLTSLAVRLPASRESTISRLLQYTALARPGIIDSTCVDLEALMTADRDSRGAHLGRWVALCLARIEGSADREESDLSWRSLLKLLRPCEGVRVEFYLEDIVLRLLISFCRFGPSPSLEQCIEVVRESSDPALWREGVEEVLRRSGCGIPLLMVSVTDGPSVSIEGFGLWFAFEAAEWYDNGKLVFGDVSFARSSDALLGGQAAGDRHRNPPVAILRTFSHIIGGQAGGVHTAAAASAGSGRETRNATPGSSPEGSALMGPEQVTDPNRMTRRERELLVRGNLAEAVATSFTVLVTISLFILVVVYAMYLYLWAWAIWIVLTNDRKLGCDVPLMMWLEVYMLTSLFRGVVQRMVETVYLRLAYGQDWQLHVNDNPVKLALLKSFLNLFFPAWLIYGQTLIATSHTCSATNSSLYTCSAWFIGVGLTIWCGFGLIALFGATILLWMVRTGRLRAKRGASPDVIDKIPTLSYDANLFTDDQNSADGTHPLNECSICFQNYSDSTDEIKHTPCDHYFHKSCLAHWLNTATTCPLCRLDLEDHYHGASSGPENV
ncbi:hypothetical protein FOZ61_002023 [Perkinsus olseni]|uniref:RING-type domain-containing protein n=2 Tax=Perkinsus olseni TaxID=32597 RepID=A0A7J6LUR5_PEROL|nr:hypothetical protein FOZ61_002023 [Perkinsus olseni]